MRRLCLQLTLSLALLGFGPMAAHTEEWLAEVAPRELHHFLVPGPQVGHFLTLDKQEGEDLGYIYEGPVYDRSFLQIGALMPTPVQDQTIPIYRYKVTMPSGVISYHYTPDGSITTPGYEKQKLVGHAYKPEETNFSIHEYYSPDRGYWYTTNKYASRPSDFDEETEIIPFGLFAGPAPTEIGVAECPNEVDRWDCPFDWDPFACQCGLPEDDPCNIYYQNACYRGGGNWIWLSPTGCSCDE